MSVPHYQLPKDMRTKYTIGQRTDTHSPAFVASFLNWVVQQEKLQIGDYLVHMTQEPFFLVAATGLGKTVAVPVHTWLRVCERVAAAGDLHPVDGPRAWIVEPRIPIAREQMEYMNSLYTEYQKSRGRQGRISPLFGCITSATKRVNPQAPIQFITTGIFALLARNGNLQPATDRVVIDEAHVTIEQSADVELAIGIARRDSVVIDYMSATVDTSNIQSSLGVANIIQADQQRFPIYIQNLEQPMEEAIVSLVDRVLVHRDVTSSFGPSKSYKHYNDIAQAVFDRRSRARGVLVVVNSFAGEKSDIRRIMRLLNEAIFAQPVQVLPLASEIVRDPVRQRRFEQQLQDIVARQGLYVVIATSVVEMGITFPALDAVATMDSGFENITLGERQVPRLIPLGTNALKQRIGRVGRRGPGVAYISREVGAAYTSYGEARINSALEYEPIRFPMAVDPLMLLAMYSFEQKWQPDNIEQHLRTLKLPTDVIGDSERLQQFSRQRRHLQQLGLARQSSFTEIGVYCDKWVAAGVDLSYAVELQRTLEDRASTKSYLRALFWTVATAASHIGYRDLVRRGFAARPDPGMSDFFGVQIPRLTDLSELVAMYQLVAFFMEESAGKHLHGLRALRRMASDKIGGDCEALGLDGRRIVELLDLVHETLGLFFEINDDREELWRLTQDPVATLSWPKLDDYHRKILTEAVHSLPGREHVEWIDHEGQKWWRLASGGYVPAPKQEDTIVRMMENVIYTGKLVPKLDEAGATAWTVQHLQVYSDMGS